MMKRLTLSFLFAAVLIAPLAAQAQRKSPLADMDAIRHRVELRSGRLEVGAGMGTTINQTFDHGVLASVRAGFHITDWLSVSGYGAFNVTSLGTGFRSELERSLDVMMPVRRTPTVDEAQRAINKPGMMFGGQLEVTPFTGKYSLFGKLFAHYDFYLFGGVGAVSLKAAASNPFPACSGDPAPNVADRGGYCVVTGTKPGATFGIGFHSFFNHFLALNVELRDFYVKDNPAGRDVNGDQNVDNNDLVFTSHLMATIGITVYLPATADISN
jgi:outer membrane beta-barrel protein